MKALAILLPLALGFGQDAGKPPDAATQQFSVPDPVRRAFARGRLDQKYEISFHLNPFYLRGDFDGDTRADYAVLIKSRGSGKIGIAIIHTRGAQVAVVGAGVPDSEGDDDYQWMDYWYVYPKGPVGRGVGETTIPRLRGEALNVGKSEAASGLLYWNGRRFLWYQQGD
jgi:hypothetical protein